MLEDQDLRSIQEVRAKIALAHEAFLKYREYTKNKLIRLSTAWRQRREPIANP